MLSNKYTLLQFGDMDLQSRLFDVSISYVKQKLLCEY